MSDIRGQLLSIEDDLDSDWPPIGELEHDIDLILEYTVVDEHERLPWIADT
jgi:hypothetical protein